MSNEVNTYEKGYEDRVQRLFNRVNNIQSINAEEKQTKLRDIENVLTELAQKISKQKEEKASKLTTLTETMATLSKALEGERERAEKLENTFNSDLLTLEKNFLQSVEEARSLRDESDKRLVTKLNTELEGLQMNLARGLGSERFEGQEELEQLIETDIPRVQAELANESALRKELEGKILEQFLEQVNELRALHEEEKKTRETKEEELVEAINVISKEVEDGLKKQKDERERNEENILELVEKVIERLKTDITEY